MQADLSLPYPNSRCHCCCPALSLRSMLVECAGVKPKLEFIPLAPSTVASQLDLGCDRQQLREVMQFFEEHNVGKESSSLRMCQWGLCVLHIH